MKISELIEWLETAKIEYGDLPVFYEDSSFYFDLEAKEDIRHCTKYVYSNDEDVKTEGIFIG